MNRTPEKPIRIAKTLLHFGLVVFVFFFLAGCGAPGDPTPPSPPVPVAVNDLTAHQAGDGMMLTFTLPAKTITGERLAEPPAVEILRGATLPDGSPDAKSFRVVYTIPGSLLNTYHVENQIQFTDPIAPQDTRSHPGAILVYLVRTRASKKRASADSNVVSVRVFPVPEPIASVAVNLSESAIELSWQAPTRTSAGDPLNVISGYRVYRGEIEPSSAEAAAKDLSQAKWKSPFVLLATSGTNSYRDTLFDFGRTYLFIIRSLVEAGGTAIESGDSTPVVVTPRDIYPPAAPQGLVAAVLPGVAPDSLLVDLSWSINVETDLAGYRVYRSEQQGARGQLLTPDQLPTPAYRDTSVEPGRRYWYTVTAVDQAGNESVPSEAAAVEVTKPLS